MIFVSKLCPIFYFFIYTYFHCRCHLKPWDVFAFQKSGCYKRNVPSNELAELIVIKMRSFPKQIAGSVVTIGYPCFGHFGVGSLHLLVWSVVHEGFLRFASGAMLGSLLGLFGNFFEIRVSIEYVTDMHYNCLRKTYFNLWLYDIKCGGLCGY